ncbi:hypothetical protein T11_10992 [Trichinella zimbabwensis]|uniref:Uncharacterized protein n=1 Tax=Trichinella zimbabwensis TaxID=268475 RepID=A0A0V1HTF0_9BILA|nr:hypothetical protein T11_10992 [Trichinella zimbabwensis]
MEAVNVSSDRPLSVFQIFIVVVGFAAMVGFLLACAFLKKKKLFNGKDEVAMNDDALYEFWLPEAQCNAICTVLSVGFVQEISSDPLMVSSVCQAAFSCAASGVGVKAEMDGVVLDESGKDCFSYN